ncbi:VanZ family protein [Paenibacillus sp. NPDC056579]|uniref:VanZ family protein n=1 Tax=unclassified Paenibacillus TaxID=185978 RepID=UPI001EF782C1|nr:VanZ family protein [Paenibacillus sp. H1-7]ULL17451.1 hypothetical protein DVH26_25170 [Paenibacillus sp. H1-7]
MRYAVRWLPSILCMTAIFYLSSNTGDDMNGWLSEIQRFLPFMQGFDWGHFAAYFVLALTFAWGITGRKLTWGMKALVVLLCLLYGVTDEYHQSFVPGRSPDPLDLRNDGIGAALAMLFLTIPIVNKTFRQWTGG